jgi:phage major head subunit gpT-like protein
MLVNQVALKGISTGFKTIFNKIFSEVQPQWNKIATLVPSETGEENYKWLGKIPRMREWIGEREIQNLTVSDYTIKNKDFELTIGVDRNDIEDDKLGIYQPIISDIGQTTAEHPDTLVFGLLKDGFTNKCYDKKPFFATDHKVGKKTVSNKGTEKLSATAYGKARAEMMSLVDENDISLKIIPNLLVVPPALESAAREILFAEQINATTNIYKGTAELLVVPELAGKDEAWYLLCTNKSIKPLIYQERKKPRFVAFFNENDEHVFKNKQFLYGVDGRCNAGYSFWQMAYGSDGSDDSDS